MKEQPTRRIQLLPPSLRNQIAAGEVVERPASVLKELLENSIDAQAKNITVNIENGGQSLLSVRDDGHGIPAEDLSLAVTRHATSKITSFEDLMHVASYGFRGEALPSIASVSHIKVESAYSFEETTTEGVFLEVQFGKTSTSGPSPLSKGTIITVRDLFENVPARLKFLKSPATEVKRCQEIFVRLALSNPEIAFTLISGGKEIANIPANLPLLQRLSKIWPAQITESMISFSGERHGVSVHGLASLPQNAQSKGDRILLYVNGRPVNDKLLLSAVRTAYKGMLTSREYPQIILFVTMDPKEVDVNAHPSKTEVRFREERNVFSAVINALQSAITQHLPGSGFIHTDPTQRNSQEGVLPDGPAHYPPLFAPSNDENKTTSFYGEREASQKQPFAIDNTSIGHDSKALEDYSPRPQGFWGAIDNPRILDFPEKSKPQDIDEVILAKAQQGIQAPPTFSAPFSQHINRVQEHTFLNYGDESLPATPENENILTPFHYEVSSTGFPIQVGSLLCFGQIAKTYLILKEKEELLLLDQHAAHERILVNQIEQGNRKGQSQLLAIPEEIVLHRAEKDRFNDCAKDLLHMGYDLELSEQQETSLLFVKGFPPLLSHSQSMSMLRDILADRTDGFDDLFHMMACRAAIKAGQTLTPDEIAALIHQWITTPECHFCPHGRPIVLRFGKNELEKMFKRKIG